MPTDASRRATSRRNFLQACALAGASTMIAGALRAQTTAPIPGPAAAPDSSATSPPDPPLSDDARALVEMIRRRHGAHLSPEQLDGIAREIDQRLQSGARLRAVPLTNADEPDSVFAAAVRR